jgi:5'-nucleotidase
VLSPTSTYRVTVNNFMADGSDGYSTFRKGTDRLGGAPAIKAWF